MRPLRNTLYRAASVFASKAVLLEGTLKGGGARLRCLQLGGSPFHAELDARTWNEPPKVVRRWRFPRPWMKRVLDRELPGCDVCVALVPVGLEPAFRDRYTWRGVGDVRQVIDTSGSWDDVRKEFVKKKRQITNDFEAKHGLSYRISSDPADFDAFYHRMHVPHIRRRYGSLSDIDSHASMLEFFRKGLLLLVTKDGTDVAGALSVVEDGLLKFRRSGVLDGDEGHVRCGAQTALYYFQIRHAVEHGIRGVDAMMSAPFLNDGVFRHKAEWGAVALPNTEADDAVLYFARPSEGTAAFFELNPVIVQAAGGLEAVVGDPKRCLPASADALRERYPARGLRGFTIVTAESMAAVR